MAIYLHNINLSGNELQNFVLQPLPTVPTNFVTIGRKFFDSAEKREKVYNGTGWLASAYISDITPITNNLAQLRTDFDALYKALNGENADDKINTWNEIVDFLDELETTGGDLSLLLADINGRFTNGVANEAAKVSNSLTVKFNGSTYIFNGSAAKEIDFSAANIVSALGTTPVNRAIADASGNNIINTYLTIEAFNPVKAWYDSLVGFIESDGVNVKIKTNLIVTGEISSGGTGSGGTTSAGSILDTWREYDNTLAGYALSAKLGIELNKRVGVLETKSTSVSFTPILNEGKHIGSITIDDVSSFIYAPAKYKWEEIDDKPLFGNLATLNSLSAVDVGATRKVVKTLTATASKDYIIKHGFETQEVIVQVYDPDTLEQVFVDVKLNDSNNIKLSFGIQPQKNYKVVIIG